MAAKTPWFIFYVCNFLRNKNAKRSGGKREREKKSVLCSAHFSRLRFFHFSPVICVIYIPCLDNRFSCSLKAFDENREQSDRCKLQKWCRDLYPDFERLLFLSFLIFFAFSGLFPVYFMFATSGSGTECVFSTSVEWEQVTFYGKSGFFFLVVCKQRQSCRGIKQWNFPRHLTDARRTDARPTSKRVNKSTRPTMWRRAKTKNKR